MTSITVFYQTPLIFFKLHVGYFLLLVTLVKLLLALVIWLCFLVYFNINKNKSNDDKSGQQDLNNDDALNNQFENLGFEMTEM